MIISKLFINCKCQYVLNAFLKHVFQPLLMKVIVHDY